MARWPRNLVITDRNDKLALFMQMVSGKGGDISFPDAGVIPDQGRQTSCLAASIGGAAGVELVTYHIDIYNLNIKACLLILLRVLLNLEINLTEYGSKVMSYRAKELYINAFLTN